MKHIKKPYERAVSLVELSVVIAAVGILIAGTFGGISLLNASKIRKAVSELTNISSSLDNFFQQYGYLPGDIPIMSDFFPAAQNGDGNSFIETSNDEDLGVWSHLSLSDLYPGSFTGQTISPTIRYGLRVNSPVSQAYQSGSFMIRTENNNVIYDTIGTAIRLGRIISDENFSPLGGIASSRRAQSIDSKLDDGFASSGAFYSIIAPNETAGCVNGPPTSTTANYLLDNNTESCNLIYWYKKF